MSSPKIQSNLKKWLPSANTTRPGGCNILATDLDPVRLFFAVVTGNRATKRLAARNLVKQSRAWAKTANGKRALSGKEGAPCE